MGRSSSCSSSSLYYEKSKRLRSEDGHHRPHRTRREDIRDYREKRRQAWRMQQKLERDHERLKKQKILEYELKREQSKRAHSRRSSHQSRSQSRSQNHSSRDRRQSLKPTAMSQKLESSDGSIPLFKGGSEMKIDATELRRIKVDIHRNIPGATVTNRQLQREIVNPEEVTLKRREDEGMKPIFLREELALLVKSLDNEKAGNKAHLLKRHFILTNSFAKSPKEDSPSLCIRIYLAIL